MPAAKEETGTERRGQPACQEEQAANPERLAVAPAAEAAALALDTTALRASPGKHAMWPGPTAAAEPETVEMAGGELS